jgi:hypothetical protein
MIVHIFVVGAFEVCTEGKAFHFFKEVRMIGQHVFKRAVLLAGLPHEDTSTFLYDLRVNDSGAVSKIRDLCLASDNSVRSFLIALRAKRAGSPGNSGGHRHSFPPLEKWPWGPAWRGQIPFREGVVNALRKEPRQI